MPEPWAAHSWTMKLLITLACSQILDWLRKRPDQLACSAHDSCRGCSVASSAQYIFCFRIYRTLKGTKMNLKYKWFIDIGSPTSGTLFQVAPNSVESHVLKAYSATSRPKLEAMHPLGSTTPSLTVRQWLSLLKQRSRLVIQRVHMSDKEAHIVWM